MKRGQPHTSPCSATAAASGASCRHRSNRPRAALLLHASSGSSSAAKAGAAVSDATRVRASSERAGAGGLRPTGGARLLRIALVDQDAGVGVLLELQDAEARAR